MLEEGTLSVNLLAFRHKNFGFQQTVSLAGTPFVVFHRTETESESKLRPRLVELFVVVPQSWVIYDEPSDELRLGMDGVHPGPASAGTALEVSADSERFAEQGIDFLRHPLGTQRILYVPGARAVELTAPEALDALGLAPTAGRG
jgi:hypothetical protein